MRSWREVRGAGWRTSVPEGWVQEAPGHFVGPGRANALLKVVDNPISMEALADLNRADLLRTSPGYELLSEHRGAVGGAPAWEWVGRLRTPAGTAVVQRTVVIDGGRRKLTITLSARASDFDQNHESFDGIVSSASLVAVDAEGDSP